MNKSAAPLYDYVSFLHVSLNPHNISLQGAILDLEMEGPNSAVLGLTDTF